MCQERPVLSAEVGPSTASPIPDQSILSIIKSLVKSLDCSLVALDTRANSVISNSYPLQTLCGILAGWLSPDLGPQGNFTGCFVVNYDTQNTPSGRPATGEPIPKVPEYNSTLCRRVTATPSFINSDS